MTLTLHTSDSGYNDKDELIEIPIVTHYTITPEVYEPNTLTETLPADWHIQKIWYGDVRYNSIEDLRADFPDAAMEIEQYLDNEVECNEEYRRNNNRDFEEYESNNER